MFGESKLFNEELIKILVDSIKDRKNEICET